jgi:hypothetical protein
MRLWLTELSQELNSSILKRHQSLFGRARYMMPGMKLDLVATVAGRADEIDSRSSQ